jgi:hypothetical protein
MQAERGIGQMEHRYAPEQEKTSTFRTSRHIGGITDLCLDIPPGRRLPGPGVS